MAFQPFNPEGKIKIHEMRLPHWRQWGATYFVTSRLADSVPKTVADEWKRARELWLRSHGLAGDLNADEIPDPFRQHYHREFTAKFHQLLDSGHGECVFAQMECRDILQEKFCREHDATCRLDCWVIMPNHFHALIEPMPGVTLGSIIKKWKGGSAFEINRILGRAGKLWQAEPYDHIVRSQEQLNHYRRYIALNPEKAKLTKGFALGCGKDFGMSTQGLLDQFGLSAPPK